MYIHMYFVHSEEALVCVFSVGILYCTIPYFSFFISSFI